MKAIHIRMEGFSAFFRLPTIISGTQLSSPLPPYSTLLGLIGCCAGQNVEPQETRIGYEYQKRGTTLEIERTNRLELDVAKGQLKPNIKGQGILYREIHIAPVLDLYLTNTNFKKYFESPIGTPTLGRSQDVVWIKLVEEIELIPQETGKIGATLLPFPQQDFGGRVVRVADYFDNSKAGYLRQLKKLGMYQAVPEVKDGTPVKTKNLFHPNNTPKEKVIYLHEW